MAEYESNRHGDLDKDPQLKICMNIIEKDPQFMYLFSYMIAKEFSAKYGWSKQSGYVHTDGFRFTIPQDCIKVGVQSDVSFGPDWPVAYHGTSKGALASFHTSILSAGFDLDAPSSRMQADGTHGGRAYGRALYLTPSWALAHYVATPCTVDPPTYGVETVRTMLQVRVRPGSYEMRRNSFRDKSIHPFLPSKLGWKDSTIEWVVREPDENVAVTGVLFCLDDTRPYDGFQFAITGLRHELVEVREHLAQLRKLEIALQTIVDENTFAVGNRVRVRDSDGEKWKTGTVTAAAPVQVLVDGWGDQSFSWNFVEKVKKKKFVVGDRVRVRDSDSEPWGFGAVTAVSPLKVLVDGWDESYSWKMAETIKTNPFAGIDVKTEKLIAVTKALKAHYKKREERLLEQQQPQDECSFCGQMWATRIHKGTTWCHSCWKAWDKMTGFPRWCSGEPNVMLYITKDKHGCTAGDVWRVRGESSDFTRWLLPNDAQVTKDDEGVSWVWQ